MAKGCNICFPCRRLGTVFILSHAKLVKGNIFPHMSCAKLCGANMEKVAFFVMRSVVLSDIIVTKRFFLSHQKE